MITVHCLTTLRAATLEIGWPPLSSDLFLKELLPPSLSNISTAPPRAAPSQEQQRQ